MKRFILFLLNVIIFFSFVSCVHTRPMNQPNDPDSPVREGEYIVTEGFRIEVVNGDTILVQYKETSDDPPYYRRQRYRQSRYEPSKPTQNINQNSNSTKKQISTVATITFKGKTYVIQHDGKYYSFEGMREKKDKINYLFAYYLGWSGVKKRFEKEIKNKTLTCQVLNNELWQKGW